MYSVFAAEYMMRLIMPIALGTTLLLMPAIMFTQAAETEPVVQEASGNGIRTLRPFEVQDNWEIRWTT